MFFSNSNFGENFCLKHLNSFTIKVFVLFMFLALHQKQKTTQIKRLTKFCYKKFPDLRSSAAEKSPTVSFIENVLVKISCSKKNAIWTETSKW